MLCMNAQIENWDDFRYFLAVARAGSLSAASKLLGVNHSTVLRRLRAMEERLAARLFNRLRTGYELTPSGEELLIDAQLLEETIFGLNLKMSGRDFKLTGVVRVTTVDSFAFGVLAPALHEFHAAYPGIQVELFSQHARASLSRREADVAIRPSDNPGDILVGKRVGKIHTALYGTHDYLAKHPGNLISDYEFVTGDEAMAHLPVEKWVKKHVDRARIVLRCNSYVNLWQIVRSGLGVGFLPTYLAEPDSSLQRLEIDNAPPHGMDLWLLTHPELRKTARIRVFMDWAADLFLEKKDLIEGRWE